ncbi:hypothetical protein Bca52824_057437 [Brassica carinata]|uniref:Uncharacterized protein n=1 Tax=Brassica carinata TaxID=52824 RepID=A0A8X7QR88_BRACI|nr:hypothetical protein Bca52824_057437 [Brassica carinata]
MQSRISSHLNQRLMMESRGHATVELSLLKSFKEVNQSVLKLESVCIIRSSRRHVNQVTGAFGGVKVVWSLPHVKEVTGSSYVV